MNWETRNGKQYLYSRKAKVVKSLGPKSERTDQIHRAFTKNKKANADRLKSLSCEMNQQSAVLRALDVGRLPVMAARTLRALRTHGNPTGIRVVGTNALYAYEALAGVVFNPDAATTMDIDFLGDDRNRLKLFTPDHEKTGLIRLIQNKVDKTFRSRGARDFRLINDKGYIIEFIRPLPSPIYRAMPGAEPIEKNDVEPAPIMGLQWLVNAPAIDAVVLDQQGTPVSMRCPDPRYWALHKAWLAEREDRDLFKRNRDREQALTMFRLIEKRLLHFPFDEALKANLPSVLQDLMPVVKIDEAQQPSW